MHIPAMIPPNMPMKLPKLPQQPCEAKHTTLNLPEHPLQLFEDVVPEPWPLPVKHGEKGSKDESCTNSETAKPATAHFPPMQCEGWLLSSLLALYSETAHHQNTCAA